VVTDWTGSAFGLTSPGDDRGAKWRRWDEEVDVLGWMAVMGAVKWLLHPVLLSSTQEMRVGLLYCGLQEPITFRRSSMQSRHSGAGSLPELRSNATTTIDLNALEGLHVP